jgi:NADH-quinone oxidoreductase subunit E
MNLKPETLKKIEEVIPHYPTKRSATLPLLHLVQEDIGYISNEAIEWIAEKLELQPINVYEVVTFYPMFRQHPIGKHHIRVCRTLSCALGGAYPLCAKMKKEFGCDDHGHSPDGEVTVEFVECLASCGSAPVMMVGDTLFENVNEAKSDQIVKEIRSGEIAKYKEVIVS